jgi:Sugar (and other) transporter
MSGVVTMTFISLYKAITMAGSFYLYAGIATAGALFIFFFLPETRGRSLEDMEVLFGKAADENVVEKNGEVVPGIAGNRLENNEDMDGKVELHATGGGK